DLFAFDIRHSHHDNSGGWLRLRFRLRFSLFGSRPFLLRFVCLLSLFFLLLNGIAPIRVSLISEMEYRGDCIVIAVVISDASPLAVHLALVILSTFARPVIP